MLLKQLLEMRSLCFSFLTETARDERQLCADDRAVCRALLQLRNLKRVHMTEVCGPVYDKFAAALTPLSALDWFSVHM